MYLMIIFAGKIKKPNLMGPAGMLAEFLSEAQKWSPAGHACAQTQQVQGMAAVRVIVSETIKNRLCRVKRDRPAPMIPLTTGAAWAKLSIDAILDASFGLLLRVLSMPRGCELCV